MEQAEAEALAEEREKEGLANGGEQREKKEKCRFLEMHMYITSALQRSDMKAVGLQLALDLLHEKVCFYGLIIKRYNVYIIYRIN